MKRNLLLGGAIVLLCGVAMGTSFRGSAVNSVAFADLERKAGERCQVYGVLDSKSIQPVAGPNKVRFDLIDEKTGQRLPVLYYNRVTALPANFPNASHARADGEYDPETRTFVSDSVLTKCPSKYDKGALDLAKQDAVRKWQAATGLKDASTN